MLRPPTTDGRAESDVRDDDAELPMKRGRIDDDPERRGPTPGNDPADGGPHMRLPGADSGSGQGDDLPQRLADRIENGSSSSVAPGEPDVLPDVEVPDTTM